MLVIRAWSSKVMMSIGSIVIVWSPVSVTTRKWKAAQCPATRTVSSSVLFWLRRDTSTPSNGCPLLKPLISYTCGCGQWI